MREHALVTYDGIFNHQKNVASEDIMFQYVSWKTHKNDVKRIIKVNIKEKFINYFSLVKSSVKFIRVKFLEN